MGALLPNNFVMGGVENASPVILSLEGSVLSDNERSFFSESRPLGFILFNKPGTRNIESPDQLRKLTDQLRECVGRTCPILIDQEGGRVQRLKPPLWRQYPPMRHFGELAETNQEAALEEMRFTILQLAEELIDGGINVTCAPVLDVLTSITHDVIGDRAFSEDPEIVARLGLSVCRTLLAAGITPVIKHLPGHGRGSVDSHKDLPRVSEPLAVLDQTDFAPFRSIAKSEIGSAVWGMAAHIVYESIDPDHPSSVSPKIIQEIIRKQIGFDGLLLSDDLDMEALGAYGDAADRAKLSLEAGCDIALYCGGNLEIMQKIAKSVPKISAEALKRLQKSAGFPKIAA